MASEYNAEDPTGYWRTPDGLWVPHHDAWERSLAVQRDQAMKKGDSDDASFWNHEIGVLQRTAESLRDYPQ
jgi:hypothetical protein